MLRREDLSRLRRNSRWAELRPWSQRGLTEAAFKVRGRGAVGTGSPRQREQGTPSPTVGKSLLSVLKCWVGNHCGCGSVIFKQSGR